MLGGCYPPTDLPSALALPGIPSGLRDVGRGGRARGVSPTRGPGAEGGGPAGTVRSPSVWAAGSRWDISSGIIVLSFPLQTLLTPTNNFKVQFSISVISVFSFAKSAEKPLRFPKTSHGSFSGTSPHPVGQHGAGERHCPNQLIQFTSAQRPP